MLTNILLISFLLFVSGCSIFAALQHLSRRPYLTILDVQKLLRQVTSADVVQLLDSRFEDATCLVLSRDRFQEAQRLRLHEFREYLSRMSHNASVLLTWANTEIWRETKFMPGMPDRERYIDLSRRLISAAIEFRLYALFALFRINIWMIFRTHPWMPFSSARIASLREIGGIKFYASYQHLREAVGDLCLAYGEDFYEDMMSVI